MSELVQQIGDLRKQTLRARRQFLKAEAQLCMTGVEMGEVQLSLGNIDAARREIIFIEDGMRNIERFLTQMPLDERPGFAAMMNEIKTGFELLRARLTL